MCCTKAAIYHVFSSARRATCPCSIATQGQERICRPRLPYSCPMCDARPYTMGTYMGLCGEVRCLNNKFCRISPLSYTRRNMFVGRLGTGRFIVELKSVICRKMHIKFSLLCSCYEMSWSCHKHPKFFCLLARFELALTCPSASPSSLASLDV